LQERKKQQFHNISRGLVVYWLGHRTCDQQVASLTPGRELPD